jgi:hypothetical protein
MTWQLDAVGLSALLDAREINCLTRRFRGWMRWNRY